MPEQNYQSDKDFIIAASQDELHCGETLRVEIDGHAVLLANVDGDIYAVDDLCTHEDSSLSLGCLKGELISCTLHGSRFNVRTGQPQEEPAERPLNCYPVRLDGNDILVNLIQRNA